MTWIYFRSVENLITKVYIEKKRSTFFLVEGDLSHLVSTLHNFLSARSLSSGSIFWQCGCDIGKQENLQIRNSNLSY